VKLSPGLIESIANVTLLLQFARKDVRGIMFLKEFRSRINKEFNNEHHRHEWISKKLGSLEAGTSILDAGAGSQQYKEYCAHLNYTSQDFDSYSLDESKSLTSSDTPYKYGKTDIVSEIWDIPRDDRSYDAVLCSEVLEHIPYPVRTISELSRLLKPGGLLILTAPSNCLRHFDPYFFSSGFSDRWYSRILPENGLEVLSCDAVGDYYSWLKVEMFRTLLVNRSNPVAILAILPAMFWFRRQRKSDTSQATLCMGYHVVARKV